MDSIINIVNEYSIFIIMGLAIITLLLFIITIVLLSSVKKLEKKYRKMMRGVNNKNLEQALNDNLDNIEKALVKSQEAIDECKNISEELKGCVNKVAIMRYKAFEDVGSDLSFSIAILDSYNDGVIITGIYSRHDSTTYAKPIDKGISRYDLSEEELHVLNEAINSKN
ncbi:MULTISPECIES: DUF4446 family protein [unclassified Clostridium]|jgi:hypothetical protein|uniref:DUF4446 family protein n=1 Tax=Clostridium TaxID=1485 RepID=UPI001C8C0629|nr:MULTISPECIES: DUF4446 family protein [unclassified Clostridium]MBX9138696.1 DUF4446 family protein [Clostridium sp. K12(2020)]MBX9145518.1 DUF4446 family protein [Clostridium sp. K13]MDU2290678.1 DUF4446 family protein [Clostridium celatum]MDU4325425.1 DUF4446 family protein [Clostridium celatum]